MDTINIAIIGANGVGKSSFMQRALKLSAPPNQGIVTFNWTESDGTQHTVNTLEVDLDAFDVEMNEPIRWPRQANGQMAPRVDGTMVLYDVTSKDSIKLLPQTLCESNPRCFGSNSRAVSNSTFIAALSVSNYPTLLVATKCDSPEDVREVDTASVSAAFTSVVASFCTSTNSPTGQRECLQAMLRSVVSGRKGIRPLAPPPLPALSSETFAT